ncbi:MAG: alanine--glyoxylate aminotransferase family protein [Candidatus Latescibacteria bacterium]|nr:alanine--glyoxylate aminotransferase family protein [Candidatus Latescibacterota bacterium]
MSPVDLGIVRPPVPAITQVLPAEPLLLMGAGPVPVPAEVARAGSMVINHLGEPMDRVVDRIKEMARYVFQTNDDKVFGVSGPASAAMEMAVGNLLWPGRTVLVLKMGTFSGRFAEMAEGVGAAVQLLQVPEGEPISAALVKARLENEEFDVVTLVQGETSCGVWNAELPQIARLFRGTGTLVIADTVCTLSTMPMRKDDWGIDVAFTASQKGLSSLPGVALISFSAAAWEIARQHPGPKPHWCLDVLRAQKFWGGEHSYHYTAPVTGLLALYEALRLICEETLERRFWRHRHSSLALQAGIEGLGLHLTIPSKCRLNSVLAIDVPRGVDAGRVRWYMSDHFKVEISGAFGRDLVRIGQMGEQCRESHVFRTLHALGVAFVREGAKLDLSQGMAELESYLSRHTDRVQLPPGPAETTALVAPLAARRHF